MCATGKWVALAILLASAARADEPLRSVEQIPPLDRNAADFYGAIAGPRPITATWTVEPETVPLDSEAILTLTVRNAINPHEIVRPNLLDRKEIAGQFQIADLAGSSHTPGAVEFRYALRPRKVGRFELDLPRFRVYQPLARGDAKFLTPFSDPPTLRVTPATKPTGPAVPLEGPDWLFAPASTIGETLHVGRFAWLVPLVFVPFAAMLWIFAWRLLFPDAVRRAKLRRSRAVRTALDRIAAAERSPDPPAAVARAIRAFLVERAGVSPTDSTPGEIAATLRSHGHPAADAAESLFRRCDAARFSGSPDTPESLAASAVELVANWDGGES